ncbi:hypothetical protein ACJJTC_016033 [Scirpophaga incertulas]
MADEGFDKTDDVDVIIGADMLNYVLDSSKISTHIPGLSAYGTCFGPVIMGSTTADQSSGTLEENYGLLASRIEDILEILEDRGTAFRTTHSSESPGVRMMFRMTWIHPDDRRYQLVLWLCPPHTRARVSEPDFNVKKYCLFCGDEANEEAEKKKAQNVRRKIYNVSTLEFKDSILKVARTRSDDAAKAVIARIEYEFDLVAAEAKYHNNCYNIFLRPTTGYKVGRPKDDSVNLAMEEIFQYIENNDDCQFSLQELKDIGKNPTIDNKTIKRRLKLKYGDKIIITEKKGSLTIICFIDNQYDILNKAWYENTGE